MKIHLLAQKQAYKANMHTHTTITDGRLSPEEIKAKYVENGYSIVAFTDHEVLVPHNDLRDEGCLPITSYEVAIPASSGMGTPRSSKTYHINLFSRDPEKTFSSAFSASRVHPKWANASAYIPKGMESFECPKEYSVDCVNSIIEKAREEGFLVSYNHPVWSLQDLSDYADLKGLWGVEVFNSACTVNGYVDTVQPLTDLLHHGARVFPLATDDAHSPKDCCHGWLCVLADRLEYADVMDALERGDFYASTGPEIKEISLCDGILTVRTSAAVSVDLATERRFSMRRGNGVDEATEFSFDVSKYLEESKGFEKQTYLRITVCDARGYLAWSRAYFLDELENFETEETEA